MCKGYGLHNFMTHQNKMLGYSSQLFIPTHDKLSVNTEHESGSVSDRSCFCLWSLTPCFSRKTYFAQCPDICCCMSVRIRAWPGSRHSCLVYPPWHYLAVRSYFCHVEFQISIMRLGNASLTVPAALTVLAICDRSKDGRARDGRRYNHNITAAAVVTNSTQQHLITIIFTSNDGTHIVSLYVSDDRQFLMTPLVNLKSLLAPVRAPPHL